MYLNIFLSKDSIHVCSLMNDERNNRFACHTLAMLRKPLLQLLLSVAATDRLTDVVECPKEMSSRHALSSRSLSDKKQLRSIFRKLIFHKSVM